MIEAIRENETRATAVGYPVYRYKLLCFVISGAIAGLAGALIANQTSYVGPALLHWVQSGTLMIMVILGGVGRFWGGLVGARCCSRWRSSSRQPDPRPLLAALAAAGGRDPARRGAVRAAGNRRCFRCVESSVSASAAWWRSTASTSRSPPARCTR